MIQNSLSPAVSVIIPIYNVEEYLAECLDSVVGQSLQDIEIICVDDGSLDTSGDIAEGYAKKYPAVKLIRKENGGPSHTRNTALEVARGQYVCFLDSDDYLDRSALEELYAKAVRDDLDIVFFDTVPFFESGEIRDKNQNYIDFYNRKGDYPGVYTGQQLFAEMRKNREFFGSACLQLIRRSLLMENDLRFYRGIVHEDNLFTFQCVMLAKRAGYLNRAFYFRRVRGDSIMTVGKTMRNVEGYVVSYGEMMVFLHGIEVDPEVEEVVSEYLYYSMYRNACNIYRSLELPDGEGSISHGGFLAEHLLGLVAQNVKMERERNRLRSEKETLTKKVKALEKAVKSGKPVQKQGLLSRFFHKLRRGVHCIREHGVAYTLRLAAKKLVRKLKAIDERYYHAEFYHALTWLPRSCLHGVQAVRKKGLRQIIREYRVRQYQKRGGKDPLVSFILPVYNVEAYLDQGMETLLGQTMRHIEIICVDDGSTDRSLEMLRGYAQKDSRVRVFTQKNQYAGAARNLGLANARGEYLVFLDSDDFFARGLAKDAYFTAKINQADVVLFGAKHYNNATKKYSEAKWLLNAFLAPKQQPFSYRDCPGDLYRITTPCPWTKMFRRQFVLDSGLQFQHLQNSNDLYFTYSALAMAKRIAVLDRPLVYYRVGMETNLQATKKKNPFCFYEAYSAWLGKLKELGVAEELRQSYVNVALSGCMHNLRSIRDLEAKQNVFERLKGEILEALELTGYPETYYNQKTNYRDMQLVMQESFETYMAERSDR